MASIRRTRAGRWQAAVRLPDGKRHSATHDTRHEAQQWGDQTERIAHQLTAAAAGGTLTWSPAGLTVFIPEDLITMDAASRLERVLRELFPAEA